MEPDSPEEIRRRRLLPIVLTMMAMVPTLLVGAFYCQGEAGGETERLWRFGSMAFVIGALFSGVGSFLVLIQRGDR